MMVLRECVRRHMRLPQIIVVDGGTDFQSTYFETLLARYEIIKKTRPPAKARFGSTCERIFGTANQHFFHNLAGNTQLSRSSRQVTKSVDPRTHAIWTLKELSRHLNDYAYEVYDTMDHPALGPESTRGFCHRDSSHGRACAPQNCLRPGVLDIHTSYNPKGCCEDFTRSRAEDK